jgi:hypothetical protein
MAKDVRTPVGSLHIREYKDKSSGEVFYAGQGDFATLNRSYAIGLKPLQRDPNAPKATEDTPTHGIWLLQGGQALTQLGVAWERPITRGDFKDKFPMFSIAMNHPDLPDWAGNLAAFPRSEDGTFAIEHRRQRMPAPAAPADDDEIPY